MARSVANILVSDATLRGLVVSTPHQTRDVLAAKQMQQNIWQVVIMLCLISVYRIYMWSDVVGSQVSLNCLKQLYISPFKGSGLHGYEVVGQSFTAFNDIPISFGREWSCASSCSVRICMNTWESWIRRFWTDCTTIQQHVWLSTGMKPVTGPSFAVAQWFSNCVWHSHLQKPKVFHGSHGFCGYWKRMQAEFPL